MFTYLFNKLPAVRRLRADLAAALAQKENASAAIAGLRAAHAADQAEICEKRDTINHLKEKRRELQHEFDGLRELVIKQTATIEILTKDRERAERSIAELRLQVGENAGREERFLRTIDNLNSTLVARNGELEDVREELAAAQTELERQARPVLFKRVGGLSDDEIEILLAGKGHLREVVAILQLLDECATQAMSEAASAPAMQIDGPVPVRGFSPEDRTFSSGGVFSLVRFKETLEAKLAARSDAKKRRNT